MAERFSGRIIRPPLMLSQGRVNQPPQDCSLDRINQPPRDALTGGGEVNRRSDKCRKLS
jgi:hypothetical protein